MDSDFANFATEIVAGGKVCSGKAPGRGRVSAAKPVGCTRERVSGIYTGQRRVALSGLIGGIIDQFSEDGHSFAGAPDLTMEDVRLLGFGLARTLEVSIFSVAPDAAESGDTPFATRGDDAEKKNGEKK